MLRNSKSRVMKKRTVELKTEPRIESPPRETPELDFLDIESAADLVSVSEATIRRKLTLGEITRYKWFSRTLVSRSELLGQIQKAPR